jgi:hypothetical protein
MQLAPTLKSRVQQSLRNSVLARVRTWFRISQAWHSGPMRCTPTTWRQPLTKLAKGAFWFSVLGDEQVLLVVQILLSITALAWIGLQRLMTPPSGFEADLKAEGISLCSLHHVVQESGPDANWAT